MRYYIELLGLILPALIIILGVVRVFLKKTRGVNGFTMLFAILLLVIGFIQFYVFTEKSTDSPGNKPAPLAVSRHSAAFNRSVEDVLNAYFRMTDGFVNNDFAAINQYSAELKTALDSFRIEELKVDSLIYETALMPYGNTKAEVSAIIADPSMEEKRGSLNIFSNELFTLLRTVRYDLAKLYWKECPFAFGEGRPGNWLSKTEEMLNPYGMEDCAEIRSTIDFMPADSLPKNDPTKN